MTRGAESDLDDIPPPPNAATAPYGTPAWWQQRFLVEDQRLIGRYCCPQAAAMGRTSCGEHGHPDTNALYAAHGLDPRVAPPGPRTFHPSEAEGHLA